MQTFYIKLGGGLITDKTVPLSTRPAVLKTLAEECAELFRNVPGSRWVIGNGAGSFGHYTAKKVDYASRPDDRRRIAAVRNSVKDLNRLVVQALQSAGLPAVSLAPHTFMRQEGGQMICDMTRCKKLLNDNQVPMVYGDVISVDGTSSRIVSTEEILHELAARLGMATTTVYATSVDGVLDKNGDTLPVLTPDTPLHHHDNHAAYDVTGGMAQKVAAGFRMLDVSKRVVIINGTRHGELTKAVRGQPAGTELRPAGWPH